MIFNNLKNRAINLDSSLDSHHIDIKIDNTEEAYNLFDELVLYKTSAIFDYLNNINQEKFKLFLKKIYLDNINQENSPILFDRNIFLKNLDELDLNLKNNLNKEIIQVKVSDIFNMLINNKGILKIKIVLFYLILEYKKSCRK